MSQRRAAIYARYSSDNQREASIEDQVRLCREIATARGWTVVEVYGDHAISGASMLRPGYQKLLEDMRASRFEVLVAEGLDRLSRDQEHTAALYKQLAYHGIRLVTVAEGEINELHVGLKGTMNALYLKDLAQKTHRGLEGRVRQGLSGGGLGYGYELVPGRSGVRRVNEAEAAIVRRIFQEYAAGASPRAIARQLNQEGVPGPQGRQWRDTAIRGHVARGTGLLNNALYIGRLVWNRQRYLKDPVSGRRRSRLNDGGRWIVEEVPELRIVGEELWQAVKARQNAIRDSERVGKARATRFWERQRARHLLTGLVHCGGCGSRMAAIGRDLLACSAARGRGTCANRTAVRRPRLEALILDALRQRLMAPALVEEFAATFHDELDRQRRQASAGRAGKERELAEVTRKLDKLIDAMTEGYRVPGLQQRLDDFEARWAALAEELAQPAPPPVRLHPRLGQIYRGKVARLQDALAEPTHRAEALGILRGLVERVEIHAREEGLEVEIIGAIVPMVELALETRAAALDADAAGSVKVVAGAGFEPATFRL
jgi:site-specific DNA recombinase